MRDFLRMTLSSAMIIILVAGCVHNVYHFKIIADRNQPRSYYNPYSPYGQPSSNFNNVEEEPINEIDEVVVTPNDEAITQEEEDNNYHRARPSSYRY